MLGWHTDTIVGYIVRIVILAVKSHGSSRWPLQRARVTSTNYEYSAYGGQVAEVTYTWELEGEIVRGHPSRAISLA